MHIICIAPTTGKSFGRVSIRGYATYDCHKKTEHSIVIAYTSCSSFLSINEMTSVRLALQQLEAATQYISAVLSSKYSSRQLVLRYGLAGAAAYILTKFVVYRLWIHPSTRLPGPPVDWIPFLGNMREIIRDEVRIQFAVDDINSFFQ